MRRTRALVLLLAGLLGVSLAACVNPNAIGVQTYGTVVGVVVDARTQKPINGAYVWIGSTTNARVTDPNGGFVIPNIPEGTQTVHVTAGGYQSFEEEIQVVQGNNPALSPISLQPISS
jgi:hypothetical protein